MAHTKIHTRPAVRSQPHSRKGIVAGADVGLGFEWRTAYTSSGFSASLDRSWLVRSGQCEMAGADSCSGRCVPWEISGAVVPHSQGRNDRRRDEVEGNRRDAYEPE